MDLIQPRKLARAARSLMFRKRHPPVGSMPGTLVTQPESPMPVIRVMRYGPDLLDECDVPDPADLRRLIECDGVVWIDVQGLGDEKVLRQVADIVHLHPLALEDAVNVPQRPKSEPYEAQHLFIARMVRIGAESGIDAEQLSLFIGPRYLLTFQERYGDVFDPVRKRIRVGLGPIRRMGPDYLAYALIDTVIDAFYPLIEEIGERLHNLEDDILERPSPRGLKRIHAMRRDLLAVRRAVWPQREAVSALIREETPLVSEPVRRYLRDSLDHASQVADVVESYREIASSLMDIYLSSTGQRTNEVMKVLTIMASIFIPLTFIAGVYGTNFHYLPELDWRWSYFVFWGVMIATGAGMLVYFRRRGWIGTPDEADEGNEDDGPGS